MSVHTYLDSSENWKFFFLRLRHSGTKNAGFRKMVHRAEFFLANAGLLETLVSVRNRTAGRRGLQNARVWQTWQGYSLRVLSWSSLNILCFVVFYKKISLKESEVWRKVISKQNYCHASVPHKVCRLLTSPVLLCKLSLKIRGRRRQVKRRFKSEFAIFQSSSRLFHLACFVECMRPLLELNS